MTEILVTIDINYDDIEVVLNEIGPTSNRIAFNVKTLVDGDNDYSEIKHLKFGYFFRDADNSLISQGSYPKTGHIFNVNYAGTVVETAVETIPNENYKLHIWVEDYGTFYEKVLDVTTPCYPKLEGDGGVFESWIWDDTIKNWVSPKPDPTTESEYYKWDESTLNWIRLNPNPIT